MSLSQYKNHDNVNKKIDGVLLSSSKTIKTNVVAFILHRLFLGKDVNFEFDYVV